MSEYIITDEQIAENQRLHGKKLLVMPVIVRCRDCEHWRRFYPESEQRFGTCRAWRYTTRFDGYCHNERKAE